MFYTDSNFESRITHTALRGNKEIIAKIKADIKVFSAKQTADRKAWRIFYRDIAKKLTTWDKHPTYNTISSQFMRHLFLAYGYLRFKSLDKIEPKTKEPKLDAFNYNGKWYAGSPDDRVINDIIANYAAKIQEAQNAA